MDVLSDAITAVRAGRPHSTRMRRPGSFAGRFAPFDGAGFHVVLQGSCWLFPPAGQPIALRAGDVAFLPHGSAHGLAGGPTPPPPAAPASLTDPSLALGVGDVELLCGAYLLDRSRAHPLLRELPDVIHLPLRVGRHTALRTAVELLGDELEQERPRPGGDAMLPALLDVLLLQILRTWFDERAADGAATGWAAALRDPAVAAALRAIHGEPGRPWTVEELGARSGLSRAPFARRFATLVGRPPLAYLTWWRLTLAARLLRDGNAPLAAVARQVGYTSEFAFAHAFKREYGTPPGAFRQQARVPRSRGMGGAGWEPPANTKRSAAARGGSG